MSRVGRDEQGAFESDRISGSRMGNISQVYAWLVAKGCVAITILKVSVGIQMLRKARKFDSALDLDSRFPQPQGQNQDIPQAVLPGFVYEYAGSIDCAEARQRHRQFHPDPT